MKVFYAIAAIIGFIVPYTDIFPFFLEHGFHIENALSQMYASRMSAAFANDVIITVVVITAFTMHEGWRIGLNTIFILVSIAASCLGGASFGLPLFLLFREYQREKYLKLA